MHITVICTSHNELTFGIDHKPHHSRETGQDLDAMQSHTLYAGYSANIPGLIICAGVTEMLSALVQC